MAFDASHHDFSSPTTTATRDAVSDSSATVDVTGPDIDAHVPFEAPTSAPSGRPTKTLRLSKGRITKPGHRSLSTSHPVMMSESDNDKRRNKLGYQRISIACAHCRRRKIRCHLAEGDLHGRCSNCIRLKKECVFYPVDQQAAIESKALSSKAGVATGSSSGVSQSPPDMGAPAFEGQQIVPSNAHRGYQGMHSGIPGTIDEGHSIPTGGHAFGGFAHPPEHSAAVYRQPTALHSPWLDEGGFQHAASSASHASPDFSTHQYWRQNSTAASGDYAPYHFSYEPPATPPTTQSANPFAFNQPRTDSMWTDPPPQSMRSMSYSQVDGYGQHMQPYGTLQQGILHQPLTSRPQLAALDTQNAGSIAGTPALRSAPLEQQHLHDLHAFSIQQPSQYYPTGMPVSAGHGYPSAHYNDESQLGTMPGDQASPTSGAGSFTTQPHQPG